MLLFASLHSSCQKGLEKLKPLVRGDGTAERQTGSEESCIFEGDCAGAVWAEEFNTPAPASAPTRESRHDS